MGHHQFHYFRFSSMRLFILYLSKMRQLCIVFPHDEMRWLNPTTQPSDTPMGIATQLASATCALMVALCRPLLHSRGIFRRHIVDIVRQCELRGWCMALVCMWQTFPSLCRPLCGGYAQHVDVCTSMHAHCGVTQQLRVAMIYRKSGQPDNAKPADA